MESLGIRAKRRILIALAIAMAVNACAFGQAVAVQQLPVPEDATDSELMPEPIGSERAIPSASDSATPLLEEIVRGEEEKDRAIAGLRSYAPMRWWSERVSQQVLPRDRWVSFDLETVLLDTLANSPRIQSVSYRTSATVHRIVQQDAAFDPTLLLGGDIAAGNDPVGNTLTTGGAERLKEQSLNIRGGARRTTRRGTELEWTQELGLLDSNSTFFVPRDQGNARLSINLTKPLLSRGGRYYNERLVTQARIENRVAWYDMRTDVEQRIAEVTAAYWTLYQLRVQLTQQRELVKRSEEIERLLSSRKNFDTGRIEIIKARSRVARRRDRIIDLQTELEKQQTRLALLVGSDVFIGSSDDLELIPTLSPRFSDTHWELRDAVAQALENRPEVRSATHDLELSALDIRISRTELEPQLNWVFNSYLAQLNGASQVAKSFVEQFEYTPGVSTGLEFELPIGRRANKAKLREAQATYRQRSENLREVLQQTQFEVETALIDLKRFAKQRQSKRAVLVEAIDEENILTVKWRLIGSDGSRVGVVLETLLDAQQRRTDAEQDLVAVEANYLIAQVELQRVMGTLLINEGIQPHQVGCSAEISFTRDHQPVSEPERHAPEPMIDAVPLDWNSIVPDEEQSRKQNNESETQGTTGGKDENSPKVDELDLDFKQSDASSHQPQKTRWSNFQSMRKDTAGTGTHTDRSLVRLPVTQPGSTQKAGGSLGVVQDSVLSQKPPLNPPKESSSGFLMPPQETSLHAPESGNEPTQQVSSEIDSMTESNTALPPPSRSSQATDQWRLPSQGWTR